MLSPTLEVSRLALGFWRLNEWKMSPQELLYFIESVLDTGITIFDHADIYGDYSCETLFGEALKRNPALRHKMQLVTKCGIKLPSEKFPGRKINFYDTSYDHILQSVHRSLKNLQTDHLDLLLIHRPDPLMDPAETARAFEALHKAGTVLHFGVSNFLPSDTDMLQAYLNFPLATNQVEISPLHLEHFENGNMAWFRQKGMHPMAWSPLGGGRLFHPNDDKTRRVYQTLSAIASRKGSENLTAVALAWLLKHPAGVLPVLGTGKLSRIREALEAFSLSLTTEEWFEIYVAARGHRMP